jgi:transcriptional regulator with XRE-family HTH domain
MLAPVKKRGINYNKFKEAREAKGLTQGDVAEKLEVTKGMVCHYELGHSMPPADKLIQLCQLLELDFNDLRAVAA